jgi:probable HAF family extracellular repeat protein
MLYTNRRGMQNLNELIDQSLGWVLREATGINDRGQIAGWGEFDGQEHAFRLTPSNSLK